MASFWKLLKTVQNGANAIGDVTQQGTTFTSELDEQTNKPGKILVEATPLGGAAGGFQLRATKDGGANIETVYWLPWKNFVATCADRRWYEESDDCNFFMTTALTGCRFTLTPTQVVHVANGAYVGPGNASQGRTNVEEEITGPRHAHTRRLSISAGPHAHDLQYPNPHRTLVFGMKAHPAWVYKVYRSHPPPGTWEIII